MITLHLSIKNQPIYIIQCKSYDIEACGITFYRGRFIDIHHNPTEYFASLFLPAHVIQAMERPFEAGTPLPNYDLRK